MLENTQTQTESVKIAFPRAQLVPQPQTVQPANSRTARALDIF